MITKTKTIKSRSNKTIGTKVTEKEYNKINELISEGLYLNSADFVREAIRDKLKSLNEITLRDIPKQQQKNEIIAYLKEKGVADALEVSEALLLDIFDVNNIMIELKNEGILGDA